MATADCTLLYLEDNYNTAQAQVDAALKYMNQSLVMAYELGNEANLYGSFRPKNYNAVAYANQMGNWVVRLKARSSRDMRFQFPSFAGPPQHFKSDMTIANLARLDLSKMIPGIEFMSVHGYPYNICSGIPPNAT